jgi:hypothetical protein
LLPVALDPVEGQTGVSPVLAGRSPSVEFV